MNFLRNIPQVTRFLLIANIIVFALCFLAEKFGIELTNILALSYFQSSDFKPYQIVTHMFTHGNIYHILFNMYGLYLFGPILERIWGPQRLMVFYLFSGIGSAIIHMLYLHYIDIPETLSSINNFLENQTLDNIKELSRDGYLKTGFTDFSAFLENKNAVSNFLEQLYDFKTSVLNSAGFKVVGASGAICGLFLAFGLMFPDTQMMLMFIPYPIKAKNMIFVFVGISVFFGLINITPLAEYFQRSYLSFLTQIAHFAHIGGMLFGYILLKYWEKFGSRFNKY